MSPQTQSYFYQPHAETSPIHWRWIALEGQDAQDFLHRVTTVNTRNLAADTGAPGCFLTAQGRIRAYFTLWNISPETYCFELDAGFAQKWKSELIAAIEQYTFSENMTLADHSGSLECLWLFPELNEASFANLTPHTTRLTDDGIRLCHHGEAPFGRPWITAWAKESALSAWVKKTLPKALPLAFVELEKWRIQALSPRVDSEITDTVIPLEIGLKDTIAPNKGCYPGQEVIERIIALGSPPKRLIQIQGQGAVPAPGEYITDSSNPPIEIGHVTSACQLDPQNWLALGLVKKLHAKEELEVRFSDSKQTKGAILKIAPTS